MLQELRSEIAQLQADNGLSGKVGLDKSAKKHLIKKRSLPSYKILYLSHK